MNETIFEVTLTGPVPTPEFVQAEVKKWVKQMTKSAGKREKGIKRAIQTPEDYDRKIHQPRIRTIKALFKDSPRKDEMLAKAEAQKPEECKKYFRRQERAFKDKSFQKGVAEEKRRGNYARYIREKFMLHGSKKENVKGLIELGVMTLSGDKSLKKYTGSINGRPVCITSPDKLKEFQKELTKSIRKWGGDVIKARYNPDIVRGNSKKLNDVVNKYRLPEFASFEPGGPSHIDFTIRGEVEDRRLGLDIQVSRTV